VLPEINDALLPIIQEYNATTLSVYTQYAVKAAELVRSLRNTTPDDPEPLPVSGIEFPVGGENESFGALAMDKDVSDICPTLTRSPFVALSGLGDTFLTADELASTLREGIELDAGALPTLDVENVTLNSYLLDYFGGKSKHELVENNGMNLSEVWNTLNTSLILLGKLVDAIDEYLQIEDEDETAPAATNDLLANRLKDHVKRIRARFYNRRS